VAGSVNKVVPINADFTPHTKVAAHKHRTSNSLLVTKNTFALYCIDRLDTTNCLLSPHH